MDRVPYSRLAQHYDEGWGGFAESSFGFVQSSLVQYGIELGRILELACGTGILARRLAECGYHVHGVDRSAEMISIARETWFRCIPMIGRPGRKSGRCNARIRLGFAWTGRATTS